MVDGDPWRNFVRAFEWTVLGVYVTHVHGPEYTICDKKTVLICFLVVKFET